jgi:2-oxo-4-hydroxy-4-carboxy--5-ureidoimidazoline (OHCU) decarboxylase
MASTDIEKLPPASSLPTLPPQTRATILDLLFEPSPALHEIFVPLTADSTFSSYDDLISAISSNLNTLALSQDPQDIKALEDVLSSHPRLGEKKVDSKMSRMEQAAMAKASSSTSTSDDAEEARRKEVEAETLRQLNQEYETAFPGLRYVVFVNGRARSVIFENMRSRIQRGDTEEERREGIKV